MAQQLMLISISVPITISQSIDNMGYHMKIEHHRNMRLCVYVRACNFSINVQQPFLSCVFFFYFFLFILFYVFYLLCASLGRLNLFLPQRITTMCVSRSFEGSKISMILFYFLFKPNISFYFLVCVLEYVVVVVFFIL